MAIGLSYIDVTALDVENDHRAVPCARYAVPVYLKGVASGSVAFVNLFHGNGWSKGNYQDSLENCAYRKMDLSLTSFKARYVQLYSGDRAEKSVFGIKQHVNHAIKMNCEFGVNVLSEDGFEYKTGKAGDYVVVGASGSNDVVPVGVFEACYQINSLERQQIPCPDLLKDAIKKALVNTKTFSGSQLTI
jgi:hypothetical protein